MQKCFIKMDFDSRKITEEELKLGASYKSILIEGHVCLNLQEHNFGMLFSVVVILNTLDVSRVEGQPNKGKYISDRQLIDAALKERHFISSQDINHKFELERDKYEFISSLFFFS
ncbi:hypothetical protein [Bacillus wiedmannii]|uniref:hypothetical protein n=1 Tax=Bacillus wiedmannii TaxID=1890302 RepID=UPI0020D27794|nr:hypothetical protein [Bacillus wiedmannii]